MIEGGYLKNMGAISGGLEKIWKEKQFLLHHPLQLKLWLVPSRTIAEMNKLERGMEPTATEGNTKDPRLGLKACLDGSGGPHLGEVTHLGEVSRLGGVTCLTM